MLTEQTEAYLAKDEKNFHHNLGPTFAKGFTPHVPRDPTGSCATEPACALLGDPG